MEPTVIPIEASKQARFEIGRLTKEDYDKEDEQQQNNYEINERLKEKRNVYEHNHKSIIEFPGNDEYFGKIFPDSLPDFNGEKFNEEDLLKMHNSTVLEDMDAESSNKRLFDNFNDTSINKKVKWP